MSLVYMGAFPPGYGGVTRKNHNLYTALEKEMHIKRVDFNKVKSKDIKEAIRLVFHFFNPKDRFVIGVSGKTTRKRFTQMLYYFNRKAMEKSIIMIMGGTASRDMSIEPEYRKCAKGYKKIYVETQSMKNEMDAAGFANVDIYPNGRFRPQKDILSKAVSQKLQCVFFSQIQPEKGADLILEAAKALPNVDFTFYGKIVDGFKKDFFSNVEKLPNTSYLGVFKGTSEAIYAKLAQYDVLLFPTKWDIEGVPGILVEGKIAGLVEIVSNKSYNAEIVRDGIEGIVLKENLASNLATAIQELDENRKMLNTLKSGSKSSAEQYFIENYMSALKEELEK